MVIVTIPIFSIGAGILFFKEKINAINIAGIHLSLVGIVMVAMAKGELGENFMLGILFLLIAVLSEVGHASITKSLSGSYSSQIIVMYQFLIGSVYLLPLFLWKGLDGYDPQLYMSVEVWNPILCLAVLCSSLAFSLWVSTIKTLGVAKSSIFSALASSFFMSTALPVFWMYSQTATIHITENPGIFSSSSLGAHIF